jgi:Transglutaminase-like superfamily/Coenzyme PQQ synthesis protein D (PqqD)
VSASAALRATVRALAPAPGRAPLGFLRRAALNVALPALLQQHHLGDLLEALDPLAGGPGAPSAAPAEGRRVLDALRRRRTTCLYRALAGFASLRAGGDPVQLLIGVRVDRGELLAHAWLARDGQPIGERDDPRSIYAVAFAYPEGRGAPGAAEERVNMGAASQDVILTELQDGSGVLLDLKSKFYFTLNRTGVAVWKLLAAGEPASAEALGERIARQFDAPAVEDVQRDVAALLRELETEGLILAKPEAGA